ncbi:MAG: haloacid dehalogenase-like hydrolase, partial [Acidobacteriota bacterium]
MIDDPAEACVRSRGSRMAILGALLLVCASVFGCASGRAPGAVAGADRDPLPSWNDTEAKRTIREFVARVVTAGGPDYRPPARRLATFDL